jgi:predicted nucleic-acid-binding protein
MIGLDTNVLARYIMQDDALQARKATRLIEGLGQDDPGFVSVVALVELVWVLTASYQLDRAQISETLDLLLRSKELRIDRAEIVLQATRRFRTGSADFSDCLIEQIGRSKGCSATMTFDKLASKSAGMTLLS